MPSRQSPTISGGDSCEVFVLTVSRPARHLRKQHPVVRGSRCWTTRHLLARFVQPCRSPKSGLSGKGNGKAKNIGAMIERPDQSSAASAEIERLAEKDRAHRPCSACPQAKTHQRTVSGPAAASFGLPSSSVRSARLATFIGRSRSFDLRDRLANSIQKMGGLEPRADRLHAQTLQNKALLVFPHLWQTS